MDEGNLKNQLDGASWRQEYSIIVPGPSYDPNPGLRQRFRASLKKPPF